MHHNNPAAETVASGATSSKDPAPSGVTWRSSERPVRPAMSAIRNRMDRPTAALGPLHNVAVAPHLADTQHRGRRREISRREQLKHPRTSHVEHRDDLRRCHHQGLHQPRI
jgi:hypothetical protein